MPSVSGILETALYVDNLQRSVEFYADLFGFRVLDTSPRMSVLQVADQQLLLLMKKGASVTPRITPRGTRPGTDATGQQHLAFAIDMSDLEA